MVPKEKRRHPRDHPPTPDPTRKYSKRQFDGIVRAWRRKLHDWDPPKAEQDLGPAVAPMIPTLAADLFGRKHFGANYALILPAVSLAAVLFSTL